MELAIKTKPNWVSDSSLAVLISGILGTHAIETTPITKNCNQRALRALVARSLVTGARLVAAQIIAPIGELGALENVVLLRVEA